MAKNLVLDEADVVSLTLAATLSGAPVLVGQIPGVALTDTDADGKVRVKTNGVFTFSVKGENNAGNVAVALGDIIYYETGQTPPLNKDNVAGIRFGYALQAVTSGAITTIQVKIGY